MRHKLLPATTLTLWILNAVVVACEAAGLRHLDDFDAGQRLLIGITIVVTIAWLLRREGIEFKIGYRQSSKDNKDD